MPIISIYFPPRALVIRLNVMYYDIINTLYTCESIEIFDKRAR